MIRTWDMSEWDNINEETKAIITPHLDEAPVKIVSIANNLGLDVSRANLGEGRIGQILKYGPSSTGYRIRVNRNYSLEEQRFTVAHEIAHFLLHKDLIGDGIDDSPLYRSYRLPNRHEREANRLAFHLLMPEKKILEVLEELRGNKNGKINSGVSKKMAERFLVSNTMMDIRLGLR